MGVKFGAKKNPRTANEWSAWLGVQVKGVTIFPDGHLVFDLGVDSLTSGQKHALLIKIGQAQAHFVEAGTEEG